MTTAGAKSDEPVVVVARAVRTRGLKGEIVAELLTDFPERFENLTELIAIAPSGERRVVSLERCWFQKGRVVLKLVGFNSIEAAQDLLQHDFAVPEAERVKLPANHYYDWELEGCEVRTTGKRQLGTVKEIVRTGGVDLLVVIDSRSSREYLLPMADSIIVDVKPSRKLIVVDPPEGLLEL